MRGSLIILQFRTSPLSLKALISCIFINVVIWLNWIGLQAVWEAEYVCGCLLKIYILYLLCRLSIVHLTGILPQFAYLEFNTQKELRSPYRVIGPVTGSTRVGTCSNHSDSQLVLLPKICIPQLHCMNIYFPNRNIFKKKYKKVSYKWNLPKFFFLPFPLPFLIHGSQKCNLNFYKF